jgi:hypothetical protein
MLNSEDGDKKNQNSFNLVFDSIDQSAMPDLAPNLKPPIHNKHSTDSQVITKGDSLKFTPSLSFIHPVLTKRHDFEINAETVITENIQSDLQDEDFGLVLMNRRSGLKDENPLLHSANQNVFHLDNISKFARQTSFLRLEPEDDHRILDLLPSEDKSKSTNFGSLEEFLMKFFKSEEIHQEDLHLNQFELTILKSFIARKFNKTIKVK